MKNKKNQGFTKTQLRYLRHFSYLQDLALELSFHGRPIFHLLQKKKDFFRHFEKWTKKSNDVLIVPYVYVGILLSLLFQPTVGNSVFHLFVNLADQNSFSLKEWYKGIFTFFSINIIFVDGYEKTLETNFVFDKVGLIRLCCLFYRIHGLRITKERRNIIRKVVEEAITQGSYRPIKQLLMRLSGNEKLLTQNTEG